MDARDGPRRSSSTVTKARETIPGTGYRRVLGHFPTGVTIVTGITDRGPAGFTIGSFTSVSLDPPLVAFLPQVESITWKSIAPVGSFCVNVLRHDQADLCWKFATSDAGDDRFADVAWTPAPSGSPILDGVGAWIDCRLEHIIELGDHLLVVGRVIHLDHHPEPHLPLIFYKGALGRFLSAE